MKNMIKLAGYRKIFDLVYAWVEGAEVQIYVNFDVDGNKVYLSLQSERSNEAINTTAIDTIEELFLDGCPLVDSDIDIRVYELGEVDCLFNVTTVELLEYATDEGFVINEYAYGHFSGETMIDFILANPDFTIKARYNEDTEEKEVIVS